MDTKDKSVDDKYRIKLDVHPSTAVDARYEGDKLTIKQMSESRSCNVDSRIEPWNLFSNRALKQVVKAENRPLWSCDCMVKEFIQVPYGPNFTSRERLTLINQIDKLSNAVGECERIHQTAVPLNYARHSLRSLTIWLFSLPFVMVKDLGLLTGPVMGIISWLLFGVYQIGYSIEDPFQGTLRLSILCDAIKKDVLGPEFHVNPVSNTDETVSAIIENTNYDEKMAKIILGSGLKLTDAVNETILTRAMSS